MKQLKPRRRKGGAPKTGVTPLIAVRLKPEVTIKVDDWADRHGIATRSDAIRRLIDKALACPESA